MRTQVSRSLPFIVLLISTVVFVSCKSEDPEAKYSRLMAKAEEFIAQDKFEEAKITLLSAVDLKPDQAHGYFQLGDVLVRLRQYRKAAEAYLAALNAAPGHREARLHLATLYLLAKEWEHAGSHVEKLLETDPRDKEALILKAGIAQGQNRLEEAERILDEVLAANPNYSAAIASKAELALRRNDLAKAEELFTTAIKLEPKNAPIRLALADLYSRENRLDEAQEILEGLVKTEPENSGLRFSLGELLLRRGLGQEATHEFEQTLERDPLRHDARDRLYDMYVTRGQNDAAKKLTAQLASRFPNDPGVDYFRGRDAELDQNPRQAAEYYHKAVSSMRKFAPAFRRAGLVTLASGNLREGLELLNQAIGVDPFDVGARIALAQEAFSRKDFAAATEHVNRVLVRYPRQLGANILLADIALALKNYGTARAVYTLLVEAFPENPIGYFKLGLLAESQDKLDEAINWYRKGIELDRKVTLGATRLMNLIARRDGTDKGIAELRALAENSRGAKPDLQVILAAAILSKGIPTKDELIEVRSLLNSALEKKPNLLSAYYTLASLLRFESDFEGAAKQYELIVSREPRLIPPRMLLGITYEQLGRSTDAERTYRNLLEIAPRFGPAANNLAWLLAEHGGDLNEALRWAKIAKEELPREASVADTLGWVFYRRGSPEAALPHLTEAVELQRGTGSGGENPEILFHLGVVKQQLGDIAGAQQAFNEVLALTNANDTWRSRIESAKSELSPSEPHGQASEK